jgi:hypothetical protein
MGFRSPLPRIFTRGIVNEEVGQEITKYLAKANG